MSEYRRPKKGDVRVFKGVKVRFGMSGGFKHDEDVKRFATSEGAGLWARGIDPNSPTVEQDTIAWLKRYSANPNNRKGQARPAVMSPRNHRPRRRPPARLADADGAEPRRAGA